MTDIIYGKEKAWGGALAAFLVSLLLQRSGAGEGPTPDQTAELIAIGTEVLTSLFASAIVFASSYIPTDSRFVTPVEGVKETPVADHVNGPLFDAQ